MSRPQTSGSPSQPTSDIRRARVATAGSVLSSALAFVGAAWFLVSFSRVGSLISEGELRTSEAIPGWLTTGHGLAAGLAVVLMIGAISGGCALIRSETARACAVLMSAITCVLFAWVGVDLFAHQSDSFFESGFQRTTATAFFGALLPSGSAHAPGDSDFVIFAVLFLFGAAAAGVSTWLLVTGNQNHWYSHPSALTVDLPASARESTPAGWYPVHSGDLRWWDGDAWTDQVRPRT